MEPIEGSETSAFGTQMPGNYPKENILHKEHGESLKSRKFIFRQGSRFPPKMKAVHSLETLRINKPVNEGNNSADRRPGSAMLMM
jgi:hypothetical protein